MYVRSFIVMFIAEYISFYTNFRRLVARVGAIDDIRVNRHSTHSNKLSLIHQVCVEVND